MIEGILGIKAGIIYLNQTKSGTLTGFAMDRH
jgi:hypothetical protein